MSLNLAPRYNATIKQNKQNKAERETTMKRKLRTEILVESRTEFLEKLVNLIEEKNTICILEEPNSGMVMVKMRESAQKYQFYMGEVFVTECKVMMNDVIGLGIIRGAHRKKAYYLAVIDAAYNANIPELEIIDGMIAVEKVRLDHGMALGKDQILKTKVDFETLDEEVKS